MRRLLIAYVILLSGCCARPDLLPTVRALRDTIQAIRKREKQGAVVVTKALAARLEQAKKLADKAIEESER